MKEESKGGLAGSSYIENEWAQEVNCSLMAHKPKNSWDWLHERQEEWEAAPSPSIAMT